MFNVRGEAARDNHLIVVRVYILLVLGARLSGGFGSLSLDATPRADNDKT
jgi:hypothetical protein